MADRSRSLHGTIQGQAHDDLECKRRIYFLTGILQLNAAAITQSTVGITIDATTINTRDPQRDARLKSADFLDTERFPTLTFKSISVSNKTNGGCALKGDLTIHGVTGNVTLDVEQMSAPHKDPWGNMRIGVPPRPKLTAGISASPGTQPSKPAASS